MLSLGFKIHAAVILAGVSFAGTSALVIGHEAEKNQLCNPATPERVIKAAAPDKNECLPAKQSPHRQPA